MRGAAPLPPAPARETGSWASLFIAIGVAPTRLTGCATIARGLAKVCVALLLIGLPVWAGDPEVAEFLLGKGQKEARAKNYEEAEKFLRRSIAEHTPNPEASFAHGEVLEKLDRGSEAAVAYQACIDAVAGADSPSSKWKGVSRRAARALAKLKKQFAALHSLNKKHLPKFLAFGKRHYKKNPRWSRRAFEIVLSIDPTNASAKAYLAKLPAEDEAANGDKPAPAKGKAWGEPQIRPDSLKNWEPGATDTWSIDRGVITGDGAGRDGHINWLDDLALHGKYALQTKFRLVRGGGNRRTIGFFIGNGKTSWWALMLDWNDEMVLLRHERGTNTAVSSRSLKDVNLSEWHTLRFEVDNKKNVEIFVDGKSMIELEVPRQQAFAGQFAFFVQAAKVQFKELEHRK